MSKNLELLALIQKEAGLRLSQGQAAPAAVELQPAMSATEEAANRTDWLRIAMILRRNWRSSAGFALAVVSSVMLYTFLSKPVYEATAVIQVDPPGTEVFSMAGSNGTTNSSEYLETEAKNLQSDELAIQVIRILHLDGNADFVPGKYKETPAPPPVGSLSWAENHALRTFQKSVWISRSPGSRLISIVASTHDPVLAATVANTMVEKFIERDYELRHNAVAQSSQWLSRQLDDIRDRMQASTKTLEEFQNKTGIAAVDDTQNSFSGQVTELSKQLMQAQADRIQLQSYLKNFKGNSDSLPQISANPVVQQLTQKLAETRAELAQTLAVYGKNHPNSKKLDNQAQELQVQLDAERTAILNDLRTSFVAAKAREGLMESQMRGTTKELALLTQYNALKKEADANVKLYDELYAKIKEASIASESKSSNIHMVDQARVMDRPARPKKLGNLALGSFVGVIGGLVLAFLREGFSNTIRSIDDVRQCVGGRSISVLPVIGAGDDLTLSDTSVGLLRTRRPKPPSYVFLLDRPMSPESEALRGLHTSVRYSRKGRPPQMLLIVSPYAGEGKTTLACNLAVALSQDQRRTCIVDLDLLKEGVAPAFAVQPLQGVTDVLGGSARLWDVIQPLRGLPNLSLLARGPAVPDPGALMNSEAVTQLLRSLREKFEFIVIDSPPIVPFSAARGLAPLVDGVILVSRAGSTKRQGMIRALELLHDVHSAPIDIVLNAAEYPSVDYKHYQYGYKAAKTAS